MLPLQDRRFGPRFAPIPSSPHCKKLRTWDDALGIPSHPLRPVTPPTRCATAPPNPHPIRTGSHSPSKLSGGITVNTSVEFPKPNDDNSPAQESLSKSVTIKRSGTAVRRQRHSRSGSGSYSATPTKTTALYPPTHSRNNSMSSKSSLSPQLSIGRPQTHSRNSSITKSPAPTSVSHHRTGSSRFQASTDSIAASIKSNASSLSLTYPTSSISSGAPSPKKLRKSRFQRRKTASFSVEKEKRKSASINSVTSLPITTSVTAARGRPTKKDKWTNVVPFLRVEKGESIGDLVDNGFFDKKLELGQPKKKLTRIPVVAFGDVENPQSGKEVTNAEPHGNLSRAGSMVITPGGFYSGERETERFSWSVEKTENQPVTLPVWGEEGRDSASVLAKVPWASAKHLSLFPQRKSSVHSIGQVGPLAVLREQGEESEITESRAEAPRLKKRMSSLRMSFLPSPTEPRGLAVLMVEDDDPAADFCESGPEASSTRLTMLPENFSPSSNAAGIVNDIFETEITTTLGQPSSSPNWPLRSEGATETSPKALSIVAIIEETKDEVANSAIDQCNNDLQEDNQLSRATSPITSVRGVRVLTMLAEEPEEDDAADKSPAVYVPGGLRSKQGSIRDKFSRPSSTMNFSCVTKEDEKAANDRLSKAFSSSRINSPSGNETSSDYEDAKNSLVFVPGASTKPIRKSECGHKKSLATESVPHNQQANSDLVDFSHTGTDDDGKHMGKGQRSYASVDEDVLETASRPISCVPKPMPPSVGPESEAEPQLSPEKPDKKADLKVTSSGEDGWQQPTYIHGPIQLNKGQMSSPRKGSVESVADWRKSDQLSKVGWERSENVVVDSIIDFFDSYWARSTDDDSDESKKEKWHSAPLLDEQLILESAGLEAKRRVVSDPVKPTPPVPSSPAPPSTPYISVMSSQGTSRPPPTKKPVGVHGSSIGQLLLKRKGFF